MIAALMLATALYDGVLKQHVGEDGKVDYGALHRDIGPLDRFVAGIAAESPASHPSLYPSREERLAYWLNAYNALVLHAFAKDFPAGKDRLRGTLGRAAFFYRAKFTVGGRQRTLDDIETNAIRREFAEPRVHFALVCASTSCPWLRREAYTSARLDAQLEDDARRYLQARRNIQVNAAAREVTVSKIFDWFQADFGGGRTQTVRFIAKYRPELREGVWRVRYFPYDWSLNEAAVTAAPRSARRPLPVPFDGGGKSLG